MRAVSARLLGVALALAGLTIPMTASAKPLPTQTARDSTIQVVLPGPLTSCPSFDARSSASSLALFDLIRPSAFLTNPNDFLVGAQGPISSAELISLTPQTVQYTLARGAKWTDGQPFVGADLVAWWQLLRGYSGVASNGYRAIRSMELEAGNKVTAVFSRPYSDWTTLFRDVEQRGASLSCSWASLLSRPSLGPYRLVSANERRWVLVRDEGWQPNGRRFGRVVVTVSSRVDLSGESPAVAFSQHLDPLQISLLASHPMMLGKIGPSNVLEELVFNSSRPVTRISAVRSALGWSIDRLGLISRMWSLTTQSVATATSALYTQGQPNYPGGGLSIPSLTTTTVSVPTVPTAGQDCLTCAVQMLQSAGGQLVDGRWNMPQIGPLIIQLGVGPTGVDHVSARAVARSWRRLGASVSLVYYASGNAAAAAAASGEVDAAIFERQMKATVPYAALSWVGPNYRDGYPSGYRTAQWNAMFNSAMSNLNPATAQADWAQLDGSILASGFVRPLFTLPSLTEWSNDVATVITGDSVEAFLDQLPSWSIVSSQ